MLSVCVHWCELLINALKFFFLLYKSCSLAVASARASLHKHSQVNLVVQDIRNNFRSQLAIEGDRGLLGITACVYLQTVMKCVLVVSTKLVHECTAH